MQIGPLYVIFHFNRIVINLIQAVLLKVNLYRKTSFVIKFKLYLTFSYMKNHGKY